MGQTLVITNGDLGAAALERAGVGGEILPWRDILHDGPVPAGLVLEALSLVRAQFIAKEFGLLQAPTARQFAARDATARNHGQYDRVELWFEHDLYDQLQLIQILDFFAYEGRAEGIFLATVTENLAEMSAEALEAAAETMEPVGDALLAAGRRAFAALGAITPQDIAAITAAPPTELPHIGPAFARLLQELPAVSSGLSVTEERLLQALAPGSRTVAELFAAVQTQETVRFLGDTAFFRRVDALAFAPEPLISGLDAASTRFASDGDYRPFMAARVRIMENGRLALAGRFDHAVENGVDRWLGGTRLGPKSFWRRSPQGLVKPGEEPSLPATAGKAPARAGWRLPLSLRSSVPNGAAAAREPAPAPTQSGPASTTPPAGKR